MDTGQRAALIRAYGQIEADSKSESAGRGIAMKPVAISLRSVLIVDDEELIHETLGKFISRHLNLRVLTAERGKDAIEIYRKELPGCVFLDIGLPDINGLEVLKAIKSINPSAKVFIVSGFDSADLKKTAKDLGADQYFTKPIVFDELIRVIESV